MMALQAVDRLLAPAVEETLAALELTDADVALVSLARRYAATIDAGAELADHADRAWSELDPDDRHGQRRLAMIERKLRDRVVLDELGPKLLSALTALGATPAARARLPQGVSPGGTNRLAQLREARRS